MQYFGKQKFLRSNEMYFDYDDPNSLVTFVTITTPLGEFTGSSMMHPDEKYPSKLTGGLYAETRAEREYFKTALKYINSQLHLMENFYKTISSMKGFNEKSNEASKARREIYELRAEKKALKTAIDDTEPFIRKREQMRIEMLEKKFNKDNREQNNA